VYDSIQPNRGRRHRRSFGNANAGALFAGDYVAVGARHFVAHSLAEGREPENHWQRLVKRYFRGTLKPPFNDSARLAAGLSRDYYAGVA
jgi:uncharacterized ferritin-like protein (DUF455 family)